MKQHEMAMLAEVQKPELVPIELIGRCNDFLQAVKLCIQYSHHSYETVREYLGLNSGNFSRMMNGTVNLPLRKIPALMFFCGNLAVLQWLANEMGYSLVEKQMDKDQLIADLKAQNAQLQEQRYG